MFDDSHKSDSNFHQNENNLLIENTSTENNIIPSTLTDLSDNIISKLLGLNVEVTLNLQNQNEDKQITIIGNIFSILKSNNLLILLRRDDKEQTSVNSYMINIENIQSIKLSDEKFEVR